MELRLTVHLPRRRPRPVEVVVTARPGAVVTDLRRALAEHLGTPVASLVGDGRPLPESLRVGSPPLLDGCSVVVGGTRPGDGAADAAGGRPRTVLEVACVSGPDAGRSLPLCPPGLEVGRSPRSGLRLDDPSLSRRHARLTVTPDGVSVEDLGATNGIRVDGRPAPGSTAVDTSSVVGIGASTLRLRRARGAGLPVEHPGDGTALVRPVPATGTPPAPARVEAPRRPEPPTAGRVPWLAALVPVPVVVGLSFVLGPHLLVFALVGPLVVIATALGDRVSGRRRHRAELARWETARARARDAFDTALRLEERERHARDPDPHEVLRVVQGRGRALWSDPPGLRVRLGLGDLASDAVWLEDGASRTGTLRGVPVVVDLGEHPRLGVVGAPERTDAVLRCLVGQLLARHPPPSLGLVVRLPVGDDVAAADWSWASRSPHGAQGRTVLHVTPRPLPDAVTPEADGPLVVAALRREDLPDACSAVLEDLGGGRVRLTLPTTSTELVGDATGRGWADRLGRGLAPLRCTGSARLSLPRTLALAEVGTDASTPGRVIEGWATSEGPMCTVGAGPDGPMRLDLRTDGPHVLVGGTTGSGKSEFLRTLVTALALGSPPERLTLLLVDFKGGAAFGPCADLPHVVGLVTDLDEHLVGRVLRSLDAELRRRERLLAAVGASDLEDHLGRDPEHPLPRLVVVVDEMRALLDDQPESLAGLVRLAAQGRSLGIHLVLATQRPSGAVTPEVQANVNLRIAFRMRDRADSVGVIESDEAAGISADTPGRGIARGSDGRSVPFQTALVAPDGTGPPVRVRSAAGSPTETDVSADRAAETMAVVQVLRAAHEARGAAPVRRPWLPPLPDVVPSADRPSDALALCDEPHLQRQDPWSWSAAVPLWRVVGRPRSGRSTALGALVRAACSTRGPETLHVHVLTDDVTAWVDRPHLGTVARLGDRGATDALLRHLEADPRTPGVTTLLVVDGWERLAELDDARDAVPTSDRVVRLLRDGAAAGMIGAVAGGRDLLRPRWGALGGEILALGGLDPLDVALLGLSGPPLGPQAPPGRGVRVRDGALVQVLAPGPVTHAEGATALPPGDPRVPWRLRPLPDRVVRSDLVSVTTPGLLLGVAGPLARPWCWDPDAHGRRFVVAGPARSGRSTALRSLAASAAAAGRPVVLVGSERSRPRDPLPLPGVGRLGPEDQDELVALRRRHPDLVVLVDDADRLDGSPVAPVLDEVADLVDRDGGAVVATTTTASLRSRFRGLDAALARHGTGLLLRPRRGDADLLGSPSTPSVDDDPPAGRGLVVGCGEPVALQVLDEHAEAGPTPDPGLSRPRPRPPATVLRPTTPRRA